MNTKARIVALKLAVEILDANGEDGMPMEAYMSPELLAERDKLDREDDIGEEMNSIIGKLKAAISALEKPQELTYGRDLRLDI